MNKTKLLIVSFILFALSFTGFMDTYIPKYSMVNDIVIKRNDGALYQKGKVNIMFKADVSTVKSNSTGILNIDKILSQYSVKNIVQQFPMKKNPALKKIGDEELARMYQISYEGNIDPTDLSKKIIDENADILNYAEPEFIYTADFIPNDPSIGSQYHISKIAAYTAWDVTQGDTNTIIGIVDSGSDLDHPDLAANIKYNYTEIPDNGIDDDGNGYIDDWRGWDFAGANYQQLSSDNNPNIVSSYCEHGSHVSGCADQVTNNGINGAGIGFKCKLLISKHGADNDNTGQGYSYIYNSNSGITYCYQNGAKVINCSYGGTTSSAQTQAIINMAWANGTVICASAGNDGINAPRYPAAYNNVVSVASTTSSDAKSYFSNYHTTVDVCAPGSSIYSTLYNNSYAYFDGTSMSSPICAGTVALIWSKYPSYTPTMIVNRLLDGCDSIYNINPSYVGLLGRGRINAYKSVKVLTGINPINSETPVSYSMDQNYPNPFNPTTKINFAIPKSSNVEINIFDARGSKMETLISQRMNAGKYSVDFNGKVYSSGIYFYTIKADGFSATKKMMLIK